MILDGSCLLLKRFSPIFLIFFYFKKSLSCMILLMYVSDFKINEFYLVNIGIWCAQKTFSRYLKISDLFDGNIWIHETYLMKFNIFIAFRYLTKF